MLESNYIAGEWFEGNGRILLSIDPATGKEIWQGRVADNEQVDDAIVAGRRALSSWANLSVEQRAQYILKFVTIVQEKQPELTKILAEETGKPLWEAKTEIDAMINKLDISKKSYADRCKDLHFETKGITSITRHKPHGLVVVIGPFNFPGHIPNGHIIPALLAGNTIILKPSELTPAISVAIMQCWDEACLPAGVINMVQGDADVSQYLTHHAHIDGIFFTGSSKVGYKIQETLLEFPNRILALEMGGNNPLVVHEPVSIEAAVYHTIHSAFITAGQRCTCARRLIMVRNSQHEDFLHKLIASTKNIKLGPYTAQPEPFMGPVISNAAAEHALAEYQELLHAGAKVLVPLTRPDSKTAFLTPGIIDVTSVSHKRDKEVFGPLLSITWVADFTAAIAEANNTKYGLVAGLIGADSKDYERFYREVNAGVINWNRPLTGASSSAPFGGIGASGNHRPSAYYAADYCAFPVASMEETQLQLPATLSPGITL